MDISCLTLTSNLKSTFRLAAVLTRWVTFKQDHEARTFLPVTRECWTGRLDLRLVSHVVLVGGWRCRGVDLVLSELSDEVR